MAAEHFPMCWPLSRVALCKATWLQTFKALTWDAAGLKHSYRAFCLACLSMQPILMQMDFVALCFLVFLGSIVHSGNTICVGRGGGSACVFSEATLVTTERLHVLRVLKWDLKPTHDVSPYLHISKIQQDHVFIFPSASSLCLSSPTITLFLKYTVITLKEKKWRKKWLYSTRNVNAPCVRRVSINNQHKCILARWNGNVSVIHVQIHNKCTELLGTSIHRCILALVYL